MLASLISPPLCGLSPVSKGKPSSSLHSHTPFLNLYPSHSTRRVCLCRICLHIWIFFPLDHMFLGGLGRCLSFLKIFKYAQCAKNKLVRPVFSSENKIHKLLGVSRLYQSKILFCIWVATQWSQEEGFIQHKPNCSPHLIHSYK